MDADWDEVARIAVPPPSPHALPTVATTIAFDDLQELLWAGNEFGRVTSFYGPELQRYTSVRAHPSAEGPVRQFLFHEKGVISLSSRSVHFITRRGLTQWHVTHPEMENLRCMSFTAQTSKIIVAGCQPAMFTIDIDKGTIVDKLPTEYNYVLMKKARYLCAATDTGSVNALSLTDFSVVRSWKAHGTMVSDMDARNDYLVTCGYSVRHLGSPIVDPLANVYDLKTLNPLPPIPFHAGAAYVRMHPRLLTTSFVASQTGQIQVVDLMNPNSIHLRQANVALMLGLEISASAEALAVNDAECMLHLWGSPSKIHFNEMSKETEFADVPARTPQVDWSNDTPLNVVGMPYYRERLLSAWPSHLVFEVGNVPSQVDPGIVPYLRPVEMGHYAPNPRKSRRYQVDNVRGQRATEAMAIAPKFLSEKARDNSRSRSGSTTQDVAGALQGLILNGEGEEDPLLKYSNVEIKYSKFGVDDFDFRFYNKTEFSGLETHIANSFTNALLQLLKFIPLIRNVALHHVATNCIYENCLLCEMGFLFDMLEKARGQNCQASNLLKTFSGLREAVNLGLLEENLTNKPLSITIQAISRFFMSQISHDFKLANANPESLEQVLCTKALESVRCMFCRNEIVRPGNTYVNELIYPTIDPKQLRRNPIYRFSNILRATIERESQNRGWCSTCRRYQQVAIRKSVKQMPLVLMINTALNNNPTVRQLWSVPGWLPERVGILSDGKQVMCFEGEDLRARQRVNFPGLVTYELVGLVTEIDIAEQKQPHLVSFINVSIAERERTEKNRWHLFNDFLVTEVDRNEVFSFNQTWKTPCTLAYQVASARHGMDDSWKSQLDTTLLFYEWSLNNKRPTSACQVLTVSEKPAAGTPVALDTEFVDLERAQIEVKSDGQREVIRPNKSGLARVSVIRGSGTLEGVPFIDDYITVKDHVVDYLTQYSGIKEGDLDPKTSRHNLVPLKVAYKKLWLLLNLGCVFVGHGLASDFRKINIKVPKSQTVDTQYLYFHPAKNRRLSLRFLAWAIFKEFIQEQPVTQNTTITTASENTSEGPVTTTSTTTTTTNEGHDSIEDARMALRLWKKFQEYSDAGIVNQILEEIFIEGAKHGFRPPKPDPAPSASLLPPPSNGNNNTTSSPASAVRLTAPVGSVSSGRNTPDFAASGAGLSGVTGGNLSATASLNGSSTPSTPRQRFRRSEALTPSSGTFEGGGNVKGIMFGSGSPLR